MSAAADGSDMLPDGSIDAAATCLEPRPGRTTADAVLVLRALGLGDALTGIPALRGIRRAWPDRFIVLAAPAVVGRWLRDLGIIDEVLPTSGLTDLTWPPAGWIGVGGHVAVNLHGRGPRSHRLLNATAPDRLLAFRSAAGGHPSGPDWRPEEHEVARWCRLVSTAGGACDADDLRLYLRPARQQHVVLHPGAASASRRWPVERWGALAAHLRHLGCQVAVTGGPAERELCAEVLAAAASHSPTADDGAGPPIVLLTGTLALEDLADVISTAALVVCGDTGVAHLATAFGTRSVLLFGPTPPARWGPAIDPDLHTVLWHGDPDHPGDPHADTLDPYLADITVEEVMTAAEDQLAAAGLSTSSKPFARQVVAASERTSSPFAAAHRAS